MATRSRRPDHRAPPAFENDFINETKSEPFEQSETPSRPFRSRRSQKNYGEDFENEAGPEPSGQADTIANTHGVQINTVGLSDSPAKEDLLGFQPYVRAISWFLLNPNTTFDHFDRGSLGLR